MIWVPFVAQRLLSRRGRGTGISVLSALGIGAGVMTLISVLGVMNGFQMTTIESILELGSYHIRVETPPEIETGSLLAQLRESELVMTAVPFFEVQTLAHGFWPDPQGVVIRAVSPGWPAGDPGAAQRLAVESGTFDLSRPGTVVLGTELARALGLRVGDPVQVMHLSSSGGAPRDAELYVTGIVRSGYLDYDRNWAFTSIATARSQLDASDPEIVGIKLHNRFEIDRATADIRQILRQNAENVGTEEQIVSWREFNAGIFGALRVEKTMMILLIGLIFVVVGTNIFQSLRRGIFERAEDIAILHALGAPSADVRLVFVLEGAIIGMTGAVLGTVSGLFIAYNINEVFRVAEFVVNIVLSIAAFLRGGSASRMSIFSPAYFYLTDVPVTVFAGEAVGIATAAVATSLAAAYGAVRRIGRYRPSEILRDE